VLLCVLLLLAGFQLAPRAADVISGTWLAGLVVLLLPQDPPKLPGAQVVLLPGVPTQQVLLAVIRLTVPGQLCEGRPARASAAAGAARRSQAVRRAPAVKGLIVISCDCLQGCRAVRGA